MFGLSSRLRAIGLCVLGVLAVLACDHAFAVMLSSSPSTPSLLSPLWEQVQPAAVPTDESVTSEEPPLSPDDQSAVSAEPTALPDDLSATSDEEMQVHQSV